MTKQDIIREMIKGQVFTTVSAESSTYTTRDHVDLDKLVSFLSEYLEIPLDKLVK